MDDDYRDDSRSSDGSSLILWLGILLVLLLGVAASGLFLFRPHAYHARELEEQAYRQAIQAEKQRDAAREQLKSSNGNTPAMFGGNPQRNLVNAADKQIATSWNVEEGKFENVLWSARLGTTSYGGPIIHGNKIFVGTNNENPRNPKIKGDKGVVMCFSLDQGELLWQALHDKMASGQDNDWPHQGVASTPVIEGNRLYYVNNRCEIICADTEGFRDGNNDGVQDEPSTEKTDADIIWRLDMHKDLKVYPRFLANCSPLLVGDLLYVVTGNGVNEDNKLPSPKAPSFLAVDKKTGKVAWQSDDPGKGVLDGQWSNPTFAQVKDQQQVIFAGGDGWIRGYDAKTGDFIWKFDGNPKKSEYKGHGKGTRNYILSTPVVHDNLLYIAMGQNPDHGAGEGHLWCIDITRKGDLSPVNDNFDPRAPENTDSGLVWHFGGPSQDKDRKYIISRSLSACAIADGLVYTADLNGYFYCLDAKTGKLLWDHDLKSGTWASPYVVDGRVYLGTEDGDIWIFAHARDKKQIGQVAMNEPVRTPVLAHKGILYVMTDGNLYAIAKK